MRESDAKTGWLISPVADVVLFNALTWIIPLYFVLRAATESLDALLMLGVTAAAAVLAGTHAVMPSLLAVTSPVYGEIRKQFWLRYFAVPALIMAGCLTLSTIVLGAVYVIWNSWHNHKTNFAMLNLYCRKAEEQSRALRRVNWIYSFFSTCVCLPVIWSACGVQLGFFLEFKIVRDLAQYATVAVTANLVAMALYALYPARARGPRILFAASIASQPLLGHYIGMPFLFITFLPHWILELGVLGAVHIREVAHKTDRWFKLFLLVVGGLCITFYFSSRYAGIQQGVELTGNLDIMHSGGYEAGFWAALTKGLYFTIVLLHFYYSGLLYRRETGIYLPQYFRG